jgi:hypothetical protein
MTIAFALVTIIASAQVSTTRDSSGNFKSVSKSRSSSCSKTGYTYTDSKGVVYPVYVNDSGRYFVVRTSKKTGNEYKQYLK